MYMPMIIVEFVVIKFMKQSFPLLVVNFVNRRNVFNWERVLNKMGYPINSFIGIIPNPVPLHEIPKNEQW